MSQTNQTVIARVQAKPGRENDVKAALMALIAPTHAENGCVNYDLHQSVDDPTLFFFHENWTSAEALDAHLQSPHFQELGAKIESEDFLAVPPDIWKMEKISG